MHLHQYKYLAALLFCLAGPQAMAAWELNGGSSFFNYVTSKNASISETNHFNELSGRIDDSGRATLEIGLASVETNIPIRNERMREILFNVMDHPRAVASVEVNDQALDSLAPGESWTENYSVNVMLHGVSQEITADLRVTKLSDNRIEVQPVTPLIINAASFNLADGVEELREVAGLGSINPNVVADFTLIFDREM